MARRARGPAREAVTVRAVSRVSGGRCAKEPELDAIAVEEPLEIRLGGRPLATTMRTPGLERELVLGFLFAEGLIREASDAAIDVDSRANVVRVRLKGRARPRVVKRGTLTSSACGVCGRVSMKDLLEGAGRARNGPALASRVLASAPGNLRRAQPSFGKTGGLHAAGAFDGNGSLLFAAEDVGRHNAVDKVVGLLLDAGALARPAVLAVSGRASFEIIQKAAAAGFPAVVSVGAPSSLAVDVADRAGILLAGFARPGRFNVYCHRERLAERSGARR